MRRSGPSPTPVGAAVVEALERLEQPLALLARDAAAVVGDLELGAVAAGERADLDRRSLAPWRSALSSRLTSTRSSSPRSARTSGRSSGTSTRTLPRGVGDREQRGADDLVERDRARGCTLIAPACRRLASSRLPTTASSRSADSSIVASSSSRSSSRPLDVGLAQAADRRLDPRERRAQVVADRGEQRGALAVDARRALAPAWPARRAAGPRRRSARRRRRPRSTRWSSANSAGPRPTSRRSRCDRHVEAQRRLARPAAPSRRRSTSVHSPLPRSRAFSMTDSMPNVSRAPLEDAVQRLLLGEVGAGERRERLRLRARLLGGARAARGQLDRAADDRRRRRRTRRSATRLVGVRDVERVQRLDEAVVDQQRRGDRGEQRDGDAADERDDHDREQVEQHLALERERRRRAGRAATVSSGSASAAQRRSPRAGGAGRGPARRAARSATGSSSRSSART